MTQDEKSDGLFDDRTSADVRMGVVSVIMILEEVIGHNKDRIALIKYANNRRKQSQNKNEEKILEISYVDRMFGCAIFHLRLNKIKKLNDNFPTEESDGFQKLHNEIDFLSNMRIYAEEVLLSKFYVDNYYDCFLRSTNRGFMTLVNENYFEFGFKLIKKIVHQF